MLADAAKLIDGNVLDMLINHGPTVVVVGLFLWYQVRRDHMQGAMIDRLGQRHEDRLTEISKSHEAHIATMMGYLRERDSQSKAIAMSGHDALRAVGKSVESLRQSIEKDRRE